MMISFGIQNVNLVAQGITVAHGFFTAKKKESIVARGDNFYNVAAQQMPQVCLAHSLALYTLKVFGSQLKSRVEFALSFAIPIVPTVIAYGAKNSQNPLLKRSFIYIHQNLGNLSQFAAIISATALLVMGQPIMALTGVSFTAIYLLEKNDLLPKNILNIINSSSMAVSISYSVIAGSIWLKLMVVSDITSFVFERYIAGKKNNVRIIEGTPIIPVTYNELNNSLSSPYYCGINKSHLNALPLKNPDVTLDLLQNICDRLDWSGIHKEKLVQALSAVERWTKRENKELTEEEFLKGTLHRILACIKDGEVLGNSAWIVLYYKNIVYLLQNLGNEKESKQVELILRLVLDGGVVINSHKFAVAEQIYLQLKIGDSATPLQEKFRYYLQIQRDKLMGELVSSESFVSNLNYSAEFSHGNVNNFMNNTGEKFLGSAFLQSFCQNFGLSMLGANNDSQCRISQLMKSFYTFLSPLDEIFWDEYNEDFIEKKVFDGIKNGVFTQKELRAWWDEWLSRQIGMDPEDRLDFNIDNINLREHKYLSAMLLDMGIFERSS